MIKFIKWVSKLWPAGKIKFYWNIAILGHSHIVYGCFRALSGELSS